MFRQLLVIPKVLTLAAAVVLLAAGPAMAQHRGGRAGAAYHGGSYLGHYGGAYSHYGYYPGHYGGYYGHYGYYPGYSHYSLGYYPGYYGSYWGYSPWYSYTPGYYLYSPSYYSYAYPSSAYQAFYPADALAVPGTPAGVDRVVHFDIRVPADAEISFDGAKTESVGPVREFVSPPLASGREYTYEVRAQWRESGHEVTQSRRITVRAGERVSITFPEKTPEKTK